MIVNMNQPVLLDNVFDFSEYPPTSPGPGEPGVTSDVKEIIILQGSNVTTIASIGGIVDDPE